MHYGETIRKKIDQIKYDFTKQRSLIIFMYIKTRVYHFNIL